MQQPTSRQDRTAQAAPGAQPVPEGQHRPDSGRVSVNLNPPGLESLSFKRGRMPNRTTSPLLPVHPVRPVHEQVLSRPSLRHRTLLHAQPGSVSPENGQGGARHGEHDSISIEVIDLGSPCSA
jgi:hypothetical protein